MIHVIFLRRRRETLRYALTGIAKCAHCGGAILSAHTRVYGGGEERVKVRMLASSATR